MITTTTAQDRKRWLYCLLLAYQSEPRDIRKAPWTARRLALAQGELSALQQGDPTRAALYNAALAKHESALS